MMDALQQKVREAGIRYFTQSPVSRIENGPSGKTVHIQSLNGSIALEARQVALCTNAFTKDFLPELNLNPGRGMIVLTKPHPAFDWKGSFHYHDGYHYFRTVDGRLLLGGGRQLDLQGETTTEPGINAIIEAQLLKDIQDFIAPGVSFEIDQKWSGVMAFGANKQPVVQRIDPYMIAGVRLGGMGVAIGASVGAAMAELLRS